MLQRHLIGLILLSLSACGAPKDAANGDVSDEQQPESTASIDHQFMHGPSEIKDVATARTIDQFDPPKVQLKLSDYSREMAGPIGFTKDDTLKSAREKMNIFFTKMEAVNMSFGTSIGATLDNKGFVAGYSDQLKSNATGPVRAYDIVVVTDSMSNDSKVIDYGVRLRCWNSSDIDAWISKPCE